MKVQKYVSKNKIIRNIIYIISFVLALYFSVSLVKYTISNISDKNSYEDTEYAVIFQCNYSNLTEVNLVNTENNTYIKGETGWNSVENPSIDIGENEFLKFIMNFQKIIGHPIKTDGEDCGFDNPTAVATIIDLNGNTHQFILGNRLKSENSYYFKYTENDNTYILSENSSSFLFWGINNFRNKTVFSPIAEDVLSVSVENQYDDFVVKKYNTENPSKSSLIGNDWYVSSQGSNQCNDEAVIKILFNDMTLKTDGFYNDDESMYNEYRLNNPLCTILYHYIDGTEKKLEIGEVINNNVYVKIHGDEYIYKVPSTFLSVLSIKHIDLLSSLGEIEKIDNVNRIDITYNDESHSLTIDKINGEEVYKCDGENITKEAFTSIYDNIMTIYIEGNIELSGDGVYVCTISIVYNDKKSNKVIDFYTYEDNYAAIIVNGELNYFTSLSKVESIIDEVKKLL